jgi:hypothetical protein
MRNSRVDRNCARNVAIKQSNALLHLGVQMLYTIVSILVVLWLVGLVAHIGGSLIHTLLVVAAVVFVFNLVSGRRG